MSNHDLVHRLLGMEKSRQNVTLDYVPSLDRHDVTKYFGNNFYVITFTCLVDATFVIFIFCMCE